MIQENPTRKNKRCAVLPMRKFMLNQTLKLADHDEPDKNHRVLQKKLDLRHNPRPMLLWTTTYVSSPDRVELF